MRMSEPVMLADRSLAKKTARSATSCGVVKRPVAAPATTDAATSSAVVPVAAGSGGRAQVLRSGGGAQIGGDEGGRSGVAQRLQLWAAVTGARDDVGAHRRERLAHSQADTFTGAGDDGDLAAQVHVHAA